MKIVLLRHGKPKLKPFKRIKSKNMAHWIDAYNHAPIDETLLPPQGSINIAQQCNLVISSQLKRSIHSAKLLKHGSPDISDPLFQEFTLPYRNIGYIRLAPYTWASLFRACWFLGFSLNAESYPEAKIRASNATEALIKHAKGHDSVLLVGHGLLNKFIAKELSKKGWHNSKKLTHQYWDYGVFEKQ